MQTANIVLRLGGDEANSVPKFNLTASEIAVLRLIHGDDSVHDVEPLGDVKRRNSDERARLQMKYGRPLQDGRPNPVNALFPGAAARVFETLDELNLPEDFFKAEKRMTASSKRKGKPAAEQSAPQAVEADGEDNDGIEEMPDNRVFA